MTDVLDEGPALGGQEGLGVVLQAKDEAIEVLEGEGGLAERVLTSEDEGIGEAGKADRVDLQGMVSAHAQRVGQVPVGPGVGSDANIGLYPVQDLALPDDPGAFALKDELYLYEVFEDSIDPLLTSGHIFDREHFYSAHHAVTGNMFCNDDWPHPEGPNLIGWTKTVENSRVVYLQPGDGPETYSSPHYRRLVENAIRWVVA